LTTFVHFLLHNCFAEVEKDDVLSSKLLQILKIQLVIVLVWEESYVLLSIIMEYVQLEKNHLLLY